jgi:membrane protein YdbS with pleckstrin-like domain
MNELPFVTDAPRGSRVAWIYGGVWGILARLFLVPEEPPQLPSLHGEPIRSFRPAPNFLKYLLLPALIGDVVISLVLIGAGVAISVAVPNLGIPLLAVLVIGLAFSFAVVVLSVYLRYDTTWYVLSDRSLRLRRGIWIIRETTITFENVQNVTVRQGPLQRFFGIADVLVETAGGGGGAATQHQGGAAPAHQGLIEGIADAPAIRDLLTSKMRASKSAGLGDDAAASQGRPTVWTRAHLAALREVRDAALALMA